MRKCWLPVLVLVLLPLAACDSSPLAEDALRPPNLSAPAEAASTADAIQFQWGETASAVSYRLQIAQSESFANPVADVAKVFLTRQVVRDLEVGERYRWRVAAVDENGVEEWSHSRSFTVNTHALAPGRPKLQSPANNARNQPLRTVVEWAPTEGAISYQLQVSLESRLQLLVVDLEDVEETRFAIRALVNTYPYWWRVRAEGPAGFGPWSSTWTFVVVN